jgi:hypothetical protein
MYMLQRSESRDLETGMFTIAPFLVAKRWKQPSIHGYVDGQTKCGIYIHFKEYYSSFKKE